MLEVGFAFWFFVPAGIANMVPVVAALIPGLRKLNAPLDFGASLHGQRLFGEHKTWRGLASGIVAATLTLWLQQYVVRKFGWFPDPAAGIQYLAQPAWLLGPVLAIGALGGDVVESFAKRRVGVKPGTAWLPYDIIDHVVGAMLVSLPFALFSWWMYPVAAVIWSLANFGVSYIGYLWGVKERPL